LLCFAFLFFLNFRNIYTKRKKRKIKKKKIQPEEEFIFEANEQQHDAALANHPLFERSP